MVEMWFRTDFIMLYVRKGTKHVVVSRDVAMESVKGTYYHTPTLSRDSKCRQGGSSMESL